MRRVFFYVCVGLAFVFFLGGNMAGKKADHFGHSITLEADETGFELSAVRRMMDEEEPEYTFAAWRMRTDQVVSAKESTRRDTVNVIEIYGSSHCILPFGKSLTSENEDGCLIGVHLAENLFGSHQVEGQQIRYKDRTLTVCGIIKEPGDLLICETTRLEEGETFERISIFLSDGADAYLTGKKFIGQYGLSTQMLRYDFYCDLSWLKELVPGKWSDFSGWNANLEKKGQEIAAVMRAEKSDIQLLYLKRLKTRNICRIFGIFCLGMGFVIYR